MSEVTNYEEYLDKHGTLTYTNVGTSMMPLLKQHRDLFTVKKKGKARCKVGDVVLYRRPPNKYVLHRVVAVRRDDYIILGDNCVNKEYGITDSDILGIMTGYVRRGRTHTVSDRSYRAYKAYILHTITVRMLLKKVKLKMKRVIKRFI